MQKYALLFSLILFWDRGLNAQSAEDNRIQTIHQFIEGYNNRDYEKMRGVMSTIIKLFFTEKRVELIYGMQHDMMGTAQVDKIEKRSESGFLIDLKYSRDTTEVQKMTLSISEKGKIIGLGNPNFKFLYPFTSDSESLSLDMAKKRIDSLAELKHRVASFNGCVLVLKDREVFYRECFGYSDFEKETPLNEHTLFDLASISKQFTAMSIMLLAHEDKLRYDQLVQDFIPEFPYKGITISGLLNHTSGLPDYMELMDEKWDKSIIANNEDVLDYLIRYKPKASFKPGKAFEYSNTGYVVLASIIERVSGKTYAQFMADHVLQPLEMTRSRVYNTKYVDNESLENIAKGYTYDAESGSYVSVTEVPELDFYRFLDGVNGDGAVNATLADLAKWDNGLREYTLIPEEEFNLALQPVQVGGESSEYGYGWELQVEDKYQKLIYHSGNWAGNTHFILHFLHQDLSVIILSNNEYFNVPLFADKVAKIMQ